MNIKKKIKDLIPVLPGKDRPIALNLLAKYDFQTLVELVDSDIQKAKIERDKHEKNENVEKVEETEKVGSKEARLFSSESCPLHQNTVRVFRC